MATHCKICDKFIPNDQHRNPTSKYYLMDRSEVYCSAQHSLDAHQAKLNNKG